MASTRRQPSEQSRGTAANAAEISNLISPGRIYLIPVHRQSPPCPGAATELSPQSVLEVLEARGCGDGRMLTRNRALRLTQREANHAQPGQRAWDLPITRPALLPGRLERVFLNSCAVGCG